MNYDAMEKGYTLVYICTEPPETMPMIARVYNRNFVHVNQVHVHFTTEGIHEPLDTYRYSY